MFAAAFDKCYVGALEVRLDLEHFNSFGARVEITCGGCDGHLGHIFRGEKHTPSNERHCVNSLAIQYVQEEPVDVTGEVALKTEFEDTMRAALDILSGTLTLEAYQSSR